MTTLDQQAPITDTTRWCWSCETRVLEHAFATGRCNTCTSAGIRGSAVRMATRFLTGGMATPPRRRQIAYRFLARSVERQAELEGIVCSISEPDFGVNDHG